MKLAIHTLMFCAAALSSVSAMSAELDHSGHMGMGHHMPGDTQVTRPSADPHAGHQGMGQRRPTEQPVAETHAGHRRPGSEKSYAAVPEPTAEERAAAFPDLGGVDPRRMMDTPILLYALLDQFEWVNTDEGSALRWDGTGWLGNDEQRLWLRTEGERADGKTGSAQLQLLYGRPLARWWDWVAGVRQDFKPGSPQTWLGAGVQGLAPYWFESEATLYLGEAGQSNLRLEAEYELLITQRIVLQPLMELNFFGSNDAHRGVGSGLAEAEAGLRLRYEIRREFAPYIGLNWERTYGNTADFERLEGKDAQETSLVVGIRFWY